MVDIHPRRKYLASHFALVLQLSRGRLPSKPQCEAGKSRAAAPRKGRTTKSTVTVPLRPGAQNRPAGGARSRGRRVPIEGVLLLIALLAQLAPRRRGSGSSCFLWTGQTDPTRPDPMIHSPHAPPLYFQWKRRSGEDRRARRTRGTRPRRALRGQRGWRRGQGIPLTLLTQEPRDGGCPRDDVRAGKRAGASR